MAGQLIVLPGVTAAASAGAPRINMNGPDTVAAKIASLKHVVSARSLTAAPSGGVVGRCRATGAALVSKGAGAAQLALFDIAGKQGLGVNSRAAAGLALPGGSLTSSFTLVAAIAINAADRAGTLATNFLSGFNVSDAYIATLLRNYGAAAGGFASKVAAGNTTTNNLASANAPAGTWGVVVIDYNNDTKTMSVAVDQGASFSVTAMVNTFAPPEGSYLELGYHVDGGFGLRDSKIGDVYTFSDSLQRTSLGKTQTVDLVNQLKAYYGIA